MPPAVTMRVRAVFLAAAALLAAQSVFIHRYGEPYPAVVMPGFEGTGGYRDGRIELARYEAVFVTAGGGEVAVHPTALLRQFPGDQWEVIAGVALSPPRPPGGDRPAGRFDRLRDAVFPGYEAGRRMRDSAPCEDSLRRWFRGRAAELVPGRSVDRVELRWYREAFRVAGGEFVPAGPREPAGVRVVQLGGGAT